MQPMCELLHFSQLREQPTKMGLRLKGFDMTDGRDRRGSKENCQAAKLNGLVELTKKFIDLLKEAEN